MEATTAVTALAEADLLDRTTIIASSCRSDSLTNWSRKTLRKLEARPRA